MIRNVDRVGLILTKSPEYLWGSQLILGTLLKYEKETAVGVIV